jgi:hypothetical protein
MNTNEAGTEFSVARRRSRECGTKAAMTRSHGRPKQEKKIKIMSKTNINNVRVPLVVTLIGAAALSAMLLPGLRADPPVIDDSQMQALTTTIGGAQVLQTTRTVPHWFGSTLDPNNGVTYGYNMVGADPNNCSGSGCDVTVTVDIIPLNVVVEGESFNGSDVVDATLASPVFALNDYGFTPFATAPGNFPNFPRYIQGPGGVLSQGDSGNQLQLEDATMRAQFNKTGSSSYHLRLNPVVHDALTIVVPDGQGTVIQNFRGVHVGDLRYQWWAPRIQNLNGSLDYIDPTHLALYLTKEVLLYTGQTPGLNGLVIIGFHGASNAYHGNGNQPVQTFAWASYILPGLFAPRDGSLWALHDIHALSHEISEWADDPFQNYVEPWSAVTDSSGCSNLLETGDAVVDIGFAMGTNIYFQGPNPDGSQTADGYYHPEDEVFLPWFMRLAPNYISEPTQSPSTNIGRYTFMGDLNQFPGFQQPATGCH